MFCYCSRLKSAQHKHFKSKIILFSLKNSTCCFSEFHAISQSSGMLFYDRLKVC